MKGEGVVVRHAEVVRLEVISLVSAKRLLQREAAVQLSQNVFPIVLNPQSL